ncbi:MAG: amidohydrolase family protein [Oscillospiraceae bacterium]|nr:amidohydrolase family protein [Oscillospiraceae bacterium]
MIMKKFDIHCHLFDYCDIPRPDGSFYLNPEEALEMFEDKNIARGVILPEIDHSSSMSCAVQRVEAVAKMVQKYPDKFYFFMNLCPHSLYNNPEADYSDLIEYYLAMGAKGVGEISANRTFYDPLMDNMLFYINKYKLPIIFHMTRHEFGDYGIRDDLQLTGLERALHKWRDITFLGHSADFWAEISGDDFHSGYPKEKVQPGGRVVELMRKYPNLHGDISAGSGLNALKRDKEFAISFLNEFQDRLYYGQDCCALPNPMKHSEYLDELLENGDISQEVYDKVCWKNAVKLLDLPLTEKDFML